MPSLDERRELLASRYTEWVPRTLDQFFDACVSHYADRPLVVTDDRTLTYGDVDRLSRRFADGLVAWGVRPGDRVGLLMANFAEFVPLKIAIARAGAIAVPFNFLYRDEELAYVLEQSRCTFLVTMTGFTGLDYLDLLDKVLSAGWADWRRSTGGCPTATFDLQQVVLFSTDGRSREGAASTDDLARAGDNAPGASAGVSRDAAEIGDILYTSGSTGSPKGVCLTHDAVLRTGYASALTRGFQDGRRILFSLPCYHMFGLVEGLLAALYVGGAIIPQTSFSAQSYLDGIERHQADDILCVPTMAIALVEFPERHQYDLSSLKAILCGSAPAPVWLWEKIEQDFGVTEIVTGYGMTECGGATTMTLPEDQLVLTSTTVGRLKMAGSAGFRDTGALAEYRTVDPESGEPLAAGETGELVSRGVTTMVGSWDNPDETSRVLKAGWLHSGDLGRIRPDGYFELTGRSKELYKSGGELVMPKEVEEVVARLDGVSQVFAIGLPDERWGEAGCVVIVRSPGTKLTEEVVIDHCKQKLARFKVPRRVVFVDADRLPVTPNGKVQKFKLASLVASLS